MARNEEEPVASDRLVEHERRGLEKVLDSISDGLGKFACNEEFTVLYFSDGLAALSEVDRADVEKQGFNSDIFIHVDDRQRVRRVIMDAVAANEPFTCTYRLYRKEGGFRWVKARGVPTGEVYQGEFPIIYVFYTDVTDVVETSEQLQEELERRRVLMDLTGEMFVEYDHVLDELTVLGAFQPYYDGPERIEHFSAYAEQHHGERNMQLLDKANAHVLLGSDIVSMERLITRVDGKNVWMSISGRTIRSDEGTLLKTIYRFSDIDDQKREREFLQLQAASDDLTGVLGPSALRSLVNRCLQEAKPQHMNAFLIFDYDDFKGINDSYGHPLGDAVLVGGANAVRGVVREQDCVGRIGGDEFCVFLDGISSIDDAACIARRICSVFPSVGEFTLGKPITCSVGMSVCVGSNASFEKLYREADAALYQAKESGRNRYVLYDQDAS